MRLSDHQNVGSECDLDIHEYGSSKAMKVAIAALQQSCAKLTPFDAKAAEAELEKTWRAEVDAAIREDSTSEILNKASRAFDERFFSVESLQEQLGAIASLIDPNRDETSLTEKEIIDTWKTEVMSYIRHVLDVSGGMIGYNALEFCAFFDDSRLLYARSDYGNMSSMEELRRRDWVVKYLRQEYSIMTDATNRFALVEFIDDLINVAIADVREFDEVEPMLRK